MRKSGITTVLQAIMITGLTFLWACGGGGGGGGDGGISPSIPYSGLETPAIITDENAETLAVGAYLGIAYSGQSGDITPMSLAEQSTSPDEPNLKSVLLFSRIWEETAVDYLTRELSTGPVFLATVSIDEPMTGDCRGYADVSGWVDDQTGDFDLDVTYHEYSDDCVVEISGRTKMQGKLDLYGLSINQVKITYEALAVSFEGLYLTQSGVWSGDFRQVPTLMTFDLVTRDEITGKTYWMRDVEMQSSPVSGTSDTEYQISGRYYDPDLGYVELTTREPLRFYFEEDYPYQGRVKLAGAGNTAALAEFVSNAVYRVTCDEDGDGQYDDYDSGIVHWPGENNPPEAVALDPVTAGRNCTVTLDGSTSFDIDTDPITSYLWTVVSIPEGSQAVLSDPSSPTPTFVPDVEGEYQFRLTVNDGIDDSVPWAPGCGVSNDELACVSVDAFFGCPYEGLEVFDVGSDPEAVAIGDVNGDGRNDVVMTTGSYSDPDNDYKLFVFPQNEAGSLVTPSKYSTGYGFSGLYQSVAVGDLNSDSRTDVVVGSDDAVGILHQNTSGSLDPMNTVTTAPCSLVRVGDVNDDGRDDIICVGWSGNVTIIAQTAGGELGTPQTYPVALGGYNDLEIGDVNGDNLTDVITMSGQGFGDNIGILLQNTSGGLDPPVYYDLGGDELTDGLGIGDVDNNGLNDVVVTVSGNYGIFYQNGSGTLDSAVNLNGYGHAGPVDVADIDNDGREDIVSIQSGWQHLELIRQQTGGALGQSELYLAPYFNITSPHGLAVGDIDGNGIKDVVKAEAIYGLVVIYDSLFN